MQVFALFHTARFMTYLDWNLACHFLSCRSSHSKMFLTIGVLENFARLTGKHLCWKHFLIMLQFYICKIFKNTFTEQLRWLSLFLHLCWTELVLISSSGITKRWPSICEGKGAFINQQLVLLKILWNCSLVQFRYLPLSILFKGVVWSCSYV